MRLPWTTGIAGLAIDDGRAMITGTKRYLLPTLACAALVAVGLLLSGGDFAAASTLSQAASTGDESAADVGSASVPPELVPPAGQVVAADFGAEGVQVYQCSSGAWVFLEPAANLLGWGRQPGSVRTAVHFRGPSWESTDDGSLVTGKAIASSPVAGSIPQLLLQATSNRGDGVFGKVTYIQRLATSGGAAPAGTCTDGQTAGVPYQAEYRFYAAGQ